MASKISPKLMKNRGCVADVFLERFGAALGRSLERSLYWFGKLLEPFSSKNVIFENIRVLLGSLERSKARSFWFLGILFSSSISGSIFDGFLKEKVPKMMPKWMPKSLKNRCNFGACGFLVFVKGISLKSFFLHVQGYQKQANIYQKSMPKRGSGKRCQKELNVGQK